MIKNKKNFAVIFDVDGVLIDSREATIESSTKVLDEYGIDFNKLIDPSGQNHMGGSARSLLALVKQQFGKDIDFNEFAKKISKEKSILISSKKIQAEPNLVRLLDELTSNSIPIGIGTNGVRSGTYNKLNALNLTHYFKVVVTSDDVENHKPHPEIYLKACADLGFKPEDCIVIEDSINGLEAALKAKTKIVYFTKHAVTKINDVKANLIVDDWSELTLLKLSCLFNT
jgi:HAD superfamily hydrolase (TIGR01509 family)